jgi:hypothetical protein
MKTKFFKIVLPTFILMLAVVSAFAFKNVEDKALLAPETGWINLNNKPCAESVQCTTDPGPICTMVHLGVTYQAFGKISENPPVCTKVLRKP